MANKFPLILNTSANQIQEIASGDNLDLTGCGINNAGVITATSFSGNITGAVTGNADTATLATNVTVTANNSTNETVYPLFVDGATGTQGAESDTGLTYNPSSGNLTSTQLTGTLQTAAQPNITSVGTLSALNVSGNVSIGGTLTYEDVTNIDAVGLVTARTGVVSPYADIDDWIDVGNHIQLGNAGIVTTKGADINGDLDVDGHTNLDNVSIAGVSTFTGAIDANGDLDVDGHTNLDNVSIAGVTTFSGDVKFTGTNNVLWDASDNALEFEDAVKLKLGSDNDIVIHHTGGYNYIEGALRIGKNNSVRITDANDDTRLQVTNTGATVTGTLTATTATLSGTLSAGYGTFTQSTGQSTVTIGSGNAGGAALVLDGDSNGDGAGADYSFIRHNTDGDLELAADNPNNDAEIKFLTGGASTTALTLAGANATIGGNLVLGSGTSSYITMVDSDNGNRQIHCNSDRIGFLKADGNWSFYSNDGGDVVCENGLTVNGGNASTITMGDADEGSRQIHCNSNNIGFLTAAGSWAARCNDAGQWQCLQGLNVTGAGVVSASLAVGSAALQNGAVASFKGGNYNQLNIAHSSNSAWGLLLANSDSTSNGGYHVSTSGNNNSCAIINVNNDALHLGTNNTLRWTINHDGHLICGGNGNLDIGGASNRVRTGYFNSINTNSTITCTQASAVDAIVIQNSSGLKLCVDTAKTVSMDARSNSGSACVLHKWNSPNLAGGSYEPYEEAWYDGNSYHNIKAENNQFVFDSAIDAPHISSTSATITLGSNLSSGSWTTLINTGVLGHNYMYAVKIFWHYQGNGGTPFYALAGFFFCPAAANAANAAGRSENLVTSCHVGGDYYLKVRSKMTNSATAGLEVAHVNWTAQANSTFTVTYKRIF